MSKKGAIHVQDNGMQLNATERNTMNKCEKAMHCTAPHCNNGHYIQRHNHNHALNALLFSERARARGVCVCVRVSREVSR